MSPRPRFSPPRFEPLEPRLALSANPTVIDLLVVYTPQAKLNRGGDSAIQSLIQSAVDTTNHALYNSLIPITIRLVHSEEIAYTTSGSLLTDLQRLQAPADGYLDSVHALRNTWGADLVSLITANTESGGVGFSPSIGFANDTTPFSAINENSINLGNLTMAHEIGHNLGSGHERGNSDGIYDYSHGYRFTGADGIVYHDIMSYDPGLIIPYYANPSVTYAGTPEGKPTSDPASADLATTFINTAPMVSAYRPTAVADTIAPRAAITSLTPNPDGRQLAFTVQYIDDQSVDASTINSSDIYVSTPEGFNLSTRLISIDNLTNAFAKTATYSVTLPDSHPSLASLKFMLRANEIKDTSSHATPAGQIANNTADQAGSDFRTARDLGNLPAAITLTDSLKTADTEDLYKFTLSSHSLVNVTLTNLTGDADFFFVKDKNNNGLYDPTQNFNDPANEYLGGSYNTSAANRGHTITLDPGTYYLWTFLQTSTSSATSYTLSIQNYATDSTPPTALADTTDLTTPNADHLDFAVQYTDDHALDADATRYASAIDIHAQLDAGYSYDFYYYPDYTLNSPNSQSVSTATIFYRIFGPQGGFTAADNGVYTLTPHNGDRAKDAAGNLVPLTPIGSYRIAIGNPDILPPTATAAPTPIVVPTQTTYDFTVTYTDNRALDATTLDNTDIKITGPNAFSQFAQFISLSPPTPGGSSRTATYRITAPGGTWGPEDNGQYTLALQPSQIKDAANNFAPANPSLATFTVKIPPPGDANADNTVDFNDLVKLAQNYNTTGTGIATGDFNFDGVTDFNDLVKLAQNYNTTYAAAAVPSSIAHSSKSAAARPVAKTPIPVFAIKPIVKPTLKKTPARKTA